MTSAPPPTPAMVVSQMAGVIDNVREHANTMNRRWGFNRLPHLVGVPLMQAFKRQKQKWEMACFECAGSSNPVELERVTKHGEAMKRAFTAMEAEAVANGHTPTPPGVWEFELPNGTPVMLTQSKAELSQVDRKRGAQVWSLEEIGNLLSRWPELVLAKEHFPEAEIIKMTPSAELTELVDDAIEDIPFAG